MKTLIIVLIIVSFLQTTILPIDLVLLILICRAYIKSDKSNLYLAFAFGLFLSFLNLANFGLESIIFLIIIQVTQMMSRSRLAGNPLLIIPVSLFFLVINQFLVMNQFINQAVNIPVNFQVFPFLKLLLGAFLSLPVLYIVRLWEERFVVQKGIKLKY